jgi:hypothetical protein
MLDPFAVFSRMASAASDVAGTTQRTSETLDASSEVIARRVEMICDAARSPLEGNYAELGRMVPEKIDAFTRAGAAMADDWWAMQSACMAEMRHMGAIAMKGRPPTMAELLALWQRNAAFGLRAFERAAGMTDKGLQPIHATAMANAKRLKKG